MLNKIFISIASYRDPEITRTISSAIKNVSNNSEIYFGVVIQDVDLDIPDLSWVKNLKTTILHPKEARGAGYARSLAMSHYNKEDYYLQIDSHTLFEKNWDDIAINQLKMAQNKTKNNKVILSHFPPPYFVESNKSVSFPQKDKERVPYPTKQRPALNKRNEWTAQRIEFEDKTFSCPEESSTVLGGFIFSEGSLVAEVPYDPDISFFGEEICFAMRAWTRGWDIYSPSKKIVYHFYGRGEYKRIWKDSRLRAKSWKDIEEFSRNKQKNVLCGTEQGIYGAGNKRSLNDYEKFCGQDFKKFYLG